LAYGQKAKAAIVHSLETYAEVFALCGMDWPRVCRRARRYAPAIAGLSPHLLSEIEGIAKGVGVELDAILALNARSEILPATFLSPTVSGAESTQALAINHAMGWSTWADLQECTAVGVGADASDDHHTRLAQNWDWLGRQRAAMVVLHTVDPRGREILTLTEAGMLAKIGLNGAGLAVGLNIVRSTLDGERPGVPVHVLLRHLLSFDSIAALRVELNRIQAVGGSYGGFGGSSNIPCADASGETSNLELSPLGWAEVAAHQSRSAHTNHFLSPSLAPHQTPMSETLSSEDRLTTAERCLSAPTVGHDALEALLRDESAGNLSICRRPDPSLPVNLRIESVCGVILDATSREMHIASHVPSQALFQRVPVELQVPTSIY
jgi:isopenicillin-N N-acyltransferase-like protein